MTSEREPRLQRDEERGEAAEQRESSNKNIDNNKNDEGQQVI